MVEPGTGNILVMAQNRTWGIGKGNQFTTYNYNVDRRTPVDANGQQTSFNGVGFQTGSTFKPFVLAAALIDKHPGQHPDQGTELRRAGRVHRLPGTRRRLTRTPRSSTTRAAQGTYDLRTGTVGVGQHVLHAQLEKQTGLCKPAQIAASMGIRRADGKPLDVVPTLDPRCEPDRRRCTWPRPTPRSPRTALHCTPRAILSISLGAKTIRCRTPAASRRSTPRSPTGSRAILAGGHRRTVRRPHRRAAVDRPPGCGQDRHHRRSRERVVLRLHPQLAAAGWVGDPTGSGAAKWSMKSVVIGGHQYSPAFGTTCRGRCGRRSWRS